MKDTYGNEPKTKKSPERASQCDAFVRGFQNEKGIFALKIPLKTLQTKVTSS